MPLPELPQPAQSILFVDDDPRSRRWFAMAFGDEFTIETAASMADAMALLEQRAPEFAVLVTDYRMPGNDGMAVLEAVRRNYRHIVRLLATAYAEKNVAIAAVNQGNVFRILEKPLDDTQTREALREALASYRDRALERAINEARVQALRESLGFLAHELNTPLATVRGYASALRGRPAPAGPDDMAQLHTALASIERRAQYCQSLVSTFVQSARDAYPGGSPPVVRASTLVNELLDEYPFEDGNRAWVTQRVHQDFDIPGRRDLLYLVLCTLTKNALTALRGTVQPHLGIEIGVGGEGAGAYDARPWLRFTDNGPGIAPDVLARLTHEPVTTRADSGGNGMGLVFCRRVMQSIHGDITVHSTPGHGAVFTLLFRGNEPAAA